MQREFAQPNGERLAFRRTAAETNGDLLEMEATYNPHSPQPPLHYHPYQDEQFRVLSGTFRTRVGESEREKRALRSAPAIASPLTKRSAELPVPSGPVWLPLSSKSPESLVMAIVQVSGTAVGPISIP